MTIEMATPVIVEHATPLGACKKCTGLLPAHFLTCPTLLLPAGYLPSSDSPEKDGNGTRAE